MTVRLGWVVSGLLWAQLATMASPLAAPRSPEASSALEFMRLAGRLKAVPRTGWMRRNVTAFERVESVADHSWRMACMGMLLLEPAPGEPALDTSKLVKLAVMHDLAEALTGDLVAGVDATKAEKRKREDEAMERIVEQAGAWSGAAAAELRALFHEYEERRTPEAVAVKDLDMLEMVLQADTYEQHSHAQAAQATMGPAPLDLSEFFESVKGKFKTPVVRRWAETLVAERLERRAVESNGQPSAKRQRRDGDGEGLAAAAAAAAESAAS